jgi:stage IV sporulation protein FB
MISKLKYQAKSKLKKYYFISNIKGIPCYIHLSLPILFSFVLILSIISNLELLIIYASIISAITIHEFGHAALVMRLNLEVHRINISALWGMCVYDEPYYEFEDIVIAWGGVLAQTLFVILIIFFYILFGNITNDLITAYISGFIFSNITMIACNLIPLEGLDGYLAWKIIPYYFEKMKILCGDKSKKFDNKITNKSAEQITKEIIENIKKKAN